MAASVPSSNAVPAEASVPPLAMPAARASRPRKRSLPAAPKEAVAAALETLDNAPTPSSSRLRVEDSVGSSFDRGSHSSLLRGNREGNNTPAEIIPPKKVAASSSSAAVAVAAAGGGGSRGHGRIVGAKVLNLSIQAKPMNPDDKLGFWNAARVLQLSKEFFLRRSFFLWVLVALLGSIAWNQQRHQNVVTQSDSSSSSSLSSSVTEKVAVLEQLFRKTTKMMQVQVDIVDMKLTKEIQSVRKETQQKMESHASAFQNEIHTLKSRTEDIENTLSKLISKAWLPGRQEVEDLVKDIIDKQTPDNDNDKNNVESAPSLDDVRAVARNLVESALEKHGADGIGIADYALSSGGGRVVEHSEGYFPGRGGPDFSDLVFGFMPGRARRHPWSSKVLEPSFGEPGQCLPLKGSNVYVQIALRTSIFPEAITLEHVSKTIAYDISSTPKEFRIFGWLDDIRKPGTEPIPQILLGEFTYDITKQSMQTFPLLQESHQVFINAVKLEVLSNYGSPSHTCLYRLRVHGSESRTAMPTLM